MGRRPMAAHGSLSKVRRKILSLALYSPRHPMPPGARPRSCATVGIRRPPKNKYPCPDASPFSHHLSATVIISHSEPAVFKIGFAVLTLAHQVRLSHPLTDRAEVNVGLQVWPARSNLPSLAYPFPPV